MPMARWEIEIGETVGRLAWYTQQQTEACLKIEGENQHPVDFHTWTNMPVHTQRCEYGHVHHTLKREGRLEGSGSRDEHKVAKEGDWYFRNYCVFNEL